MFKSHNIRIPTTEFLSNIFWSALLFLPIFIFNCLNCQTIELGREHESPSYPACAQDRVSQETRPGDSGLYQAPENLQERRLHSLPAALLELPYNGESASSRLLEGDQIHPPCPPLAEQVPFPHLSCQGCSPRPRGWPFTEIHVKDVISVLEVQTSWISKQDLASLEEEIVTFLNFLALLLLRAQDAINLHFCCTFPQSCPQTAHPRGAPGVSSFARAQVCICCYWISLDPWQLPSPS